MVPFRGTTLAAGGSSIDAVTFGGGLRLRCYHITAIDSCERLAHLGLFLGVAILLCWGCTSSCGSRVNLGNNDRMLLRRELAWPVADSLATGTWSGLPSRVKTVDERLEGGVLLSDDSAPARHIPLMLRRRSEYMTLTGS